MVEIWLNMLFYRSLIGVYDGSKGELHILDTLACSEENKAALTLLCQARLQRGETEVTVDSRFVKEKGKLF